MRIALCNGKGGTGKTTLSVLLACALSETGKRIALHDLDPQATASLWVANSQGMKVLQYEKGADYDAVFVDTAPRLDLLPGALADCSLAVIACSPSPADLWTSQHTAQALHRAGFAPESIRLLFNGVSPNTMLARELPDLAKRIGVSALRSTVSRRQCYQHAALMGWKALDASAREELFKAALEIVTTRRAPRRGEA